MQVRRAEVEEKAEWSAYNALSLTFAPRPPLDLQHFRMSSPLITLPIQCVRVTQLCRREVVVFMHLTTCGCVHVYTRVHCLFGAICDAHHAEYGSIPTVHYIPDFVSVEEERQMLDLANRAPGTSMRFVHCPLTPLGLLPMMMFTMLLVSVF